VIIAWVLKYWKVIAGICTLIGGVASFLSVANYYESKGYKRAVVEIQRESADKIAQATDDALKAAEIEIAKALERQRTLFDADLKRAKEERIVETEFRDIINEVEKIVYVKSECGTITDDSLRLLKQSVNNANRTTVSERRSD